MIWKLYLKVAVSGRGAPTLWVRRGRFLAFPPVPITHILWGGDDEFPAEANILFDETIAQLLSHRRIAALAGASVYRLMGAAPAVYTMRGRLEDSANRRKESGAGRTCKKLINGYNLNKGGVTAST